MSKQIYKFQLPLHGSTTLCLGYGSKVLHVGEQNSQLYIWVEVTDAPPAVRHFQVYLTGDSVGDLCHFIGTVLMDAGHYVVHVYEDTAA